MAPLARRILHPTPSFASLFGYRHRRRRDGGVGEEAPMIGAHGRVPLQIEQVG